MTSAPYAELSILALPGTVQLTQRQAARLAGRCLIGVLVTLGALGLLAAGLVYRSGDDVRTIAAARDGVDFIRRELGVTRTADRGMRLDPNAGARERLEEAGSALASSIRAASDAVHDAADRQQLAAIRDATGLYLAALDRMQTALVAGSSGRAETLDRSEVGPAFERVVAQVDAAVEANRLRWAARMDALVALQQRVVVIAPLVLLIGIGIAAALWTVLRGAQRQLEHGLITEASAICHGERRFRSLLQNAPDLTLLCGATGLVLYSSPAAEAAWCHAPGALLGQSVLALVHPDEHAWLQTVWAELVASPAVEGGTVRRLELQFRDGDGRWRRSALAATNLLDDAAVAGVLVTVHDVGDRRAGEAELAQLAFYDPATRLPSRLLFRDRLDQALVRAGRYRGVVGLIVIELEGEPDDMVAAEVSARLRASVRAQDTVARLASDSFAVIHEFKDGQGDAMAVAEAVSDRLRRVFRTAGRDVPLRARTGLALADTRRDGAEALLRDARFAAGQAVVGGCATFEHGTGLNAFDRVELANDLRWVDTGQEMLLHYQPIVQLGSGELEGMEALLRWNHPRHGLVSPDVFLPIAEETGMIVPLGRWVLIEACRQVAQWKKKFPVQPPLTLSVNLSRRQFAAPSLIADVERALEVGELPPECLKLEVTEATLMQDLDATVRTLWSLKRLGIRLAVDDFGTGYSSLAFLKQLPLDLLKIDGVFIKGVDEDAEDAAIVRAMVAVAASLGMQVTGEGIETATQAATLWSFGCQYGQGFHYSRALAAEEAGGLLQSTAPNQFSPETRLLSRV